MAYRDWSGLPMELLLIVMAAMEVPELVRSGGVCRLWRLAFITFRGLRLPSTRQQVPCLLYGRRSDAAVFLYSPSTHTNYRVPLSAEAASGVVGSAYGWLFTTDLAANPYLLNPLTGARAALPPITTLKCVMGTRLVFSAVDGDDDHRREVVAYDVKFGAPSNRRYRKYIVASVTAQRAREWMYCRVAMSASPSAGAGCIVVLIHMPYQELSFARLGDERWTSLSEILTDQDNNNFKDVVHNPSDGLFYLLDGDSCEVRSLDLTGPSPVATMLEVTLSPSHHLYSSQRLCYLVITPRGDLLLVQRLWRKSVTTLTGEDISSKPTVVPEEERVYDVSTTLMRVSKRQDDEFVPQENLSDRDAGVDYALFLGYGGATVCLAVEDYHLTIDGNCAYLTDDSDQTHSPPCKRLDLGIRELGSGSSRWSLDKLGDVWRLHQPWLDNSPVPIWITPSLD
ncbi:hypothetical protein GUJ93_ZPchr0011g27103 [Zizania palustris]|uniref:KIB1-4 beta-propeller domain-containing protein n=1 Tax=Zizania palustris TaxID=103762 RepID=A0A8J5WKE1_ZIZPA|nr:hypothetical protein GUJ93_ZPchr0011g27103 [Zizania palustris]